jgi:signal transduction histidine kinase
VVNLVSNAKHACLESRQSHKEIVITTERSNGKLVIAIKDNGVGIAPENINQIFNYGFTTRKAGHGFGLHSCATTAKALGGRLIATSDGVNQGARFTLELPLNGDPHRAHA